MTPNPPRGQRRWTADEEALLTDKYGLISDAALARRLGRTPAALHVRAHRLGIRHSDNFYTACQAGAVLGVDNKTVTAWIHAGRLHAAKAPYKHGSRGRPWRILAADLEAFVQAHPDRLDFKRVPDGYWRTLLRRYADPAIHRSRTVRRWTATEDAYLINHRREQTSTALGTALGRTPGAVHARLKWLRATGRFLPYKGPWRTRVAHGPALGQAWSAAEDSYLRTHWGRLREDNTGKRGTRYTAQEVADHLQRSLTSVTARASRLELKNAGWTTPEQHAA